MPTKFHVGDRVEDKETHKRGRVTFVYSELELKGEFIAVLFDGRDEALAVPTDLRIVVRLAPRRDVDCRWRDRLRCIVYNLDY
jgi:hypothetical protein